MHSYSSVETCCLSFPCLVFVKVAVGHLSFCQSQWAPSKFGRELPTHSFPFCCCLEHVELGVVRGSGTSNELYSSCCAHFDEQGSHSNHSKCSSLCLHLASTSAAMAAATCPTRTSPLPLARIGMQTLRPFRSSVNPMTNSQHFGNLPIQAAGV